MSVDLHRDKNQQGNVVVKELHQEEGVQRKKSKVPEKEGSTHLLRTVSSDERDASQFFIRIYD